MSTEKIGAGTSTVRPIRASYLLLGFALRPTLMHSCHDTALGKLKSGQSNATQIAGTLGADRGIACQAEYMNGTVVGSARWSCCENRRPAEESCRALSFISVALSLLSETSRSGSCTCSSA